MTEIEMIKKAQSGDEEAFRELMEMHQSKVYNLLLGMLRSPDTANELTQETFIKAWKNLSRFRLESALWTWLYRIAYRSALDYLKSKRDEVSLDVADPNIRMDEHMHISEPLEIVMENAKKQELLSALNELSFNNRVAIILFYFQGLSYSEISTVTKRRLGSIRTDLHRGKNKLRKILCRKWGIQNGAKG